MLKIFKISCYIIILLMFNFNCSIYKKYHFPLDTTQGSYLNIRDIQKIKIGMKKSEILLNLGSPPTLKNLFGSNIWYYVYYSYHSNSPTQYQTITLVFDNNDVLIQLNIQSNIKNTLK